MFTLIDFKKNIEEAIRNTPRFIKEALEESQLEERNKQNLMKGLDAYGSNMPIYRDPDYANFKTSINASNRGFWDLRVSGEYHKWLIVDIRPAVVFFKNPLNNEKAQWLHQKLGNRHLGLPEKEFEQIQLNNAPKIREKIIKILLKK